MEPRELIENALNALVRQDAASYMSFFDDEVAYEAPPKTHLGGRYAYFREMVVYLTARSGARATSFEITHVGSAEAEGPSWVQATLLFEVTKNGQLFPDEDAEYATQEAEHWYGVQADRIVAVKVFPKAHVWRYAAAVS